MAVVTRPYTVHNLTRSIEQSIVHEMSDQVGCALHSVESIPGEEILSRLKGTLEWMCLVTMIEGRAATKAGR